MGLEDIDYGAIATSPILNSNFHYLDNTIGTVSNTVSSHSTSIGNINNSITTLSSTVDGHTASISSLNTTVADHTTSINNINSNYANKDLSNLSATGSAVISSTATGSCSKTDMSNTTATGKRNITKFFSYGNSYGVGNGWVNQDAPGWIIFNGYSGEGVHCWGNINGVTVWRNDQSAGGGRAGSMGSASLSWCPFGSTVNYANASATFIKCGSY